MQLSKISQLLNQFNQLPALVNNPTYLELCRYPGSRFEEVCSRLLSFYLDPNREHQLGYLCLQSLLQLLGINKPVDVQKEKVTVKNEENAQGKRIDILVNSSKWAIVIENKIYAGLYNPLAIYSNWINFYNSQNFKVVLSLRKLTTQKDQANLNDHGFINITYAQYFQQIKNNLSQFDSNANIKYLAYLNDFIETMDNMNGQKPLNEETANFFFDNEKQIDELIEMYERYNHSISSAHINKIKELQTAMTILTQKQWGNYEGWLILFEHFVPNKSIKLEGVFKNKRNNSLGYFNISITIIGLENWDIYKEKLLKRYNEVSIDKNSKGVSFYIAKIEDGNDDAFIDCLKEHYNFLSSLGL